MHDQTAVRTEGIAEQFRLHPGVLAEVDEGYRALANEFPQQVSAPPKPIPKAREEQLPHGERDARREARRRQSCERIAVEHASAEYKQWHPLQRYTRRREDFAETLAAIAGLVCDRAARRPTRCKTSTELVHVRPTHC